jgi:hypothetical protein
VVKSHQKPPLGDGIHWYPCRIISRLRVVVSAWVCHVWHLRDETHVSQRWAFWGVVANFGPWLEDWDPVIRIHTIRHDVYIINMYMNYSYTVYSILCTTCRLIIHDYTFSFVHHWSDLNLNYIGGQMVARFSRSTIRAARSPRLLPHQEAGLSSLSSSFEQRGHRLDLRHCKVHRSTRNWRWNCSAQKLAGNLEDFT